MKKYSEEYKLKVVKYYFKYKTGYVNTAKHFGDVSDTSVLQWVRRYKECGEDGFKKNDRKNYSGDFKVNVIKYMHSHHLSYLETAIHFKLGSNNIVSDWEKIYYEKGPQGLYKRKKTTRNVVKRNMKKPLEPKEIKKDIKDMTKEELMEQYEYLRMENAYLKKLQALVQKRTNQQQEKK